MAVKTSRLLAIQLFEGPDGYGKRCVGNNYILPWIELPLKILAGKEERRGEEGKKVLTSNFRGRYGHSRGSEKVLYSL